MSTCSFKGLAGIKAFEGREPDFGFEYTVENVTSYFLTCISDWIVANAKINHWHMQLQIN